MEVIILGIKCIIKTTRIMPTLGEEALLALIIGLKEDRQDNQDKDAEMHMEIQLVQLDPARMTLIDLHSCIL